MSGTPLVSVVMGAYNCMGTVGASVESILGQDYRDLEFLICDDGSTDSTASVIESHAREDSRIVFLRNDRNEGLARTLNRCLEAASGEYVARMDGDDISRSDRIGMQLRFLEANPAYDLCGSSMALFDGSGVWGRVDYPERPEPRDFLLRSPFVHPSVIFRTAVLRAAGGYDCDPAIGRSEDYELFMRLYASGSKGYNFREYLLEYREELGAYRKRKFKYAVAEARVRARGFHRLGLLPLGLLYVAKPIIVGLLPKVVYKRVRKTVFGG
jgi:glycosyltransferase EpsE